jgi:hypothetical protein
MARWIWLCCAETPIGKAGALQGLHGRRIDLGHAIGQLEAEQLGRAFQALVVLGHLEDLALIGPLAFEDGGGVMHRMGEDMDLGVAPIDELTVEPDDAVAIVEGGGAHGREAPRSRCLCGVRLYRLGSVGSQESSSSQISQHS